MRATQKEGGGGGWRPQSQRQTVFRQPAPWSARIPQFKWVGGSIAETDHPNATCPFCFLQPQVKRLEVSIAEAETSIARRAGLQIQLRELGVKKAEVDKMAAELAVEAPATEVGAASGDGGQCTRGGDRQSASGSGRQLAVCK